MVDAPDRDHYRKRSVDYWRGKSEWTPSARPAANARAEQAALPWVAETTAALPSWRKWQTMRGSAAQLTFMR